MALLELANLTVSYGSIRAVQGISMSIHEGEIVALLGANGAGKTTTIRAISGLVAPEAGDIRFRDQSLLNVPAHRIVERGISQCPEGRRVFGTLSVEENLRLGAYVHRQDAAWLRRGQQTVYELFPRLAERQKQLAGTLSGGEQQMLAIGRALMARPRLLLLDEPSLGLAPILVQEIFRIIQEIKEQEGVTILLVEQNARLALKIADRGYVLTTGEVTVSGASDALVQDEQVRQAYLGGSAKRRPTR